MKKKILVVDDTAENVEILIELLSKEYDVMATLESTLAIEIVEEDNPDLILLDIMMPDIDGYEICRRLKLNESTKNIPVIFITAKVDEESIEMAYEVGGCDYVTKPFKPKELLARVSKELKVQELIYSLRASQEELMHLSSIDYLTKLYNRRYFSQASEYILELSKRNKTDLSVIMLDIDNFKEVNDTYGHKLGDKVLVNLSKLLKEHTRKSDVVCRWGGEEFLILLPETNIEGALSIAQTLRENVEELILWFENDLLIKFTISLGIATLDTENDATLETCINRADDALYEAKNSGRNRACINE